MTDAPELHPFVRDERLRKLERLRKRAQFLQTQKRGRRANHKHFVVYVAPNGLAYNRLGLTTSRKVGNAVVRNHWRRILREAFRLNKASMPQGYDLVVIVKPKQTAPPLDRLTEALIDRVRAAVGRLTRET